MRHARTHTLAMGLEDYAGLAFLALVWSSSFALIKIAVASMPPASMTVARLVVAATALLLVMRLRGHRLPAGWRPWAVFAVVGILGNATPFMLIAYGETTVDSALAAILMGSMPVTTAVLAHLLFRDERLTARRSAGVAVGFAGVLALVGWDALAGLGSHLLGQLAVLGGALCYALTTLFVRRFGRYPDLAMAAGAALCGAAAMTPVALVLDRPATLRPEAAAVAAVLVLGLLATAAASLVFFALVRRVGAGNFAQVNYLTPGLGVVWGVLLLAEKPAPLALLALGMILAGVWLVTGAGRASETPGAGAAP